MSFGRVGNGFCFSHFGDALLVFPNEGQQGTLPSLWHSIVRKLERDWVADIGIKFLGEQRGDCPHFARVGLPHARCNNAWHVLDHDE
jgi:hypothetical protein